MKRQRMMLGAALVLLAAAGRSADAKVVNVDFGQHGDHPGGVVSALYSGTAAAPDAGTVWNELQVLDNNAFDGPPGEFGFWSSDVTVSSLLDSQGAATPLSITAVGSTTNNTGAFGVLAGSPNIGAVATDAVNLMRDYLIGFNAPQSVVLNGFAPFTTVDLYLYGAGDTSNRDTMFSVTDINGAHSATTTGTITGDGNFPVAHTLTLGGDYVVLSGLKADASGSIAISYFHGAGSGEGPFDGLQAVYGVVPEPGTAALACLCCAPLLRRKRK